MIASVDGCKGGWVVAVADGWPCKTPPRLMFSASFAAIVSDTRTCHAVVVDMPIGLPSGLPTDNEHRECDKLAREHLGLLGRDRVFFAPPRPTLTAKSPGEFQSIQKRLVKKGAGVPVWGIAEKL